MNEVLEIEKNVAGLRKITLRAFYGKNQGKLTVSPVRSKRTNRLMGVPMYSQEEKMTAPKIIDAETEFTIEDGTEINLDDKYQAMDWDWIKYCPEIEDSIEACLANPHALFYVENVQRDTMKRVKERSYKKKAFDYIEAAEPNRLHDIMRLLKLDPTTFSALDMTDFFGEMADTNPKKLVEAFEDGLVKIKLFLYGMVDKKMVVIDQDGVYRYGNYVLGTNEKSALDWLQFPENAAIIKRMHDDLYPTATFPSPGQAEDVMLPEMPKEDSELERARARERYTELFDKNPGNMKTENILKSIAEKEQELDKGKEFEL